MSIFKIIVYIFFTTIIAACHAIAIEANIIYNSVNDSILTLINYNAINDKIEGVGSGVAIKSNLLATNCHVAQASQYLAIKTDSNIYLGKIVYKNTTRDLCLVNVPKVKFKPVITRESNSVNIGEEVVAIGNPLGIEKTLSKGIISNIHEKGIGNFKEGPILQTDASISPGSSGGGVFDNAGKLVGITTFKFDVNTADNLAFAIPTEWINEALITIKRDQITENRKYKDDIKNFDQKNVRLQFQLFEFGDDNVTVHYNEEICLLYLHGKTKNNKLRGGTFIIPKSQNVLFTFLEMNESIISVYSLLSYLQEFNNDSEDFNIKNFSGYMYAIENEPVEISRYHMKNQNEVYISFLNKNPITNFKRGTYIIAYIFNDSDNEIEPIKYGLNGYSSALNFVEKNCN